MLQNINVEEKGRPAFIVFEGIDGSGKTTQIQLLKQRLKAELIRFYGTKEPTDGPIGSLIRQVLTGRIQMDLRALSSLFVADRLDHLQNTVDGLKSKLNSGVHVICDRYYFSSYAYNGVDLPMDWVIQANSFSANILRPTVNLFLDVDPNNAVKRMRTSRLNTEIFERLDRLTQVRQKYFEAFDKLKDVEKVIIIDGNRSEEEVAETIWNEVRVYMVP